MRESFYPCNSHPSNPSLIRSHYSRKIIGTPCLLDETHLSHAFCTTRKKLPHNFTTHAILSLNPGALPEVASWKKYIDAQVSVEARANRTSKVKGHVV
jgi:hypothetical protein